MKKAIPRSGKKVIGAKREDAIEDRPPVKDRVRQSLTIDELSQIIHKSVASIRSDMSRHPERLPNWWKCPGGAKRPLWLVSTVEAFIEKHAARSGVGDEGEKS